ncbi:MAG TPA: Rne/Rng family ribonuclease [Phycisphaerae bacterium]|nr:Rne/Rng family ribonuclease [Phycisphaerae bacterium]HNU46218.1 Rne/Rng family ribonuclease [Phycisphaerae bacterium]
MATLATEPVGEPLRGPRAVTTDGPAPYGLDHRPDSVLEIEEFGVGLKAFEAEFPREQVLPQTPSAPLAEAPKHPAAPEAGPAESDGVREGPGGEEHRRTGRRRGGRRHRRRRQLEQTGAAPGNAPMVAAKVGGATPPAAPAAVPPRGDREVRPTVPAPTAVGVGEPGDADEAAGGPSGTRGDAGRSRSARRRARRERRRDAARAGGSHSPVAEDQAYEVGEETEIGPGDDEEEVESDAPVGDGTREMVINVSPGEECRIAILHKGRLEELFIERESFQSHVGNIYKGRVTNVEPSIQAVFVDFGFPKNGFLHVSDVQPQYFPARGKGGEDIGRKTPRHARPLIQHCFRRGQEVIVQITKEGVGTKGPTLTTYLSIPGRYLVMMPGMSRHGVSRKIEDEIERRKMREQLAELKLPPDMGFIMRTAGVGHSKRELQHDLNYLLRLWKTVVERIKTQPTPAELYRESDLVTRTIRDVYTSDFRRVVVDDKATAEKVREFLRIAMPRTKAVVEEHTEREPLFHHLGIEEEIERIHLRHVPLASGGSLVIEPTEAMVAIDVNSGRFRAVEDAEESALKINLEAAAEIARQLRLRDLGGLIVCDFIDMREERNKRKVERALRDALKSHKERARILRISSFGLVEMTRQRQRPSITRNLYHECPHCKGRGLVKMSDSVALDAMRVIQLAVHHKDVQRVIVTLSHEMAFRLLNRKRAAIHQVETETGKVVAVQGSDSFASDQMEYRCEDRQGQPVVLTTHAAVPAGRG